MRAVCSIDTHPLGQRGSGSGGGVIRLGKLGVCARIDADFVPATEGEQDREDRRRLLEATKHTRRST